MKDLINKKGYTFVELIITLALVAIMIVPIFNSFTSSYRINLLSKRQSASAFVAQEVMENIKSMNQGELDQLMTTPSLRSFVENGADTDFTVTIGISDVTDELGLAISTTSLSTAENRDADVTISLPSQGGLGDISFHNDPQTAIISDADRDLMIEVNDSSGIQLVFRDTARVINFVPQEASVITIDVEGPTSGTLLSWNIDFVNLTYNNILDIQKVNDPDDHIQLAVKSDEFSSSSILIGNSIPTLQTQVSTPKKWYQITVTVSYNGVDFETIESTVGK